MSIFLHFIIVSKLALTHIIVCVILQIRKRIREGKGGSILKSYSSREVIAELKRDGWYEVRSQGSHHQFKHPAKKGTVTVKHPDKDIPRKTLDCIERQSGLIFRQHNVVVRYLFFFTFFAELQSIYIKSNTIQESITHY